MLRGNAKRLLVLVIVGGLLPAFPAGSLADGWSWDGWAPPRPGRDDL